jgi:hypothetical protein
MNFIKTAIKKSVPKYMQDLPWVECLEITTKIGCPINCSRYCPQDILLTNYGNEEKKFSLDNFKIVLSNLPAKMPLMFSGFGEPFANEKTIDLIRYARDKEHPVGIFTTLYSLSQLDVRELLKFDYCIFRLHLCDGKYTKMNITREYQDNIFLALQNIPNISLVIMNDLFRTDNREAFNQDNYPQKNLFLRRCYKWDFPQFVVLPNGDVNLCCVDFGLRHKLGNLFIEKYSAIRKRYRPGYMLCRRCDKTDSFPVYVAVVIREYIKRKNIFA